MKYSKGQWLEEGATKDGDAIVVSNSSQRAVATVVGYGKNFTEEEFGNLVLILNAPAMYEQLKYLASVIDMKKAKKIIENIETEYKNLISRKPI